MELAILSLDKFINEKLITRLNKYTLITCLFDIAKGIQIVHKNQYIHRDIAAKNVLLI